MPQLKFSVPHALPRQEALNRIKNMLAELQKVHQENISDVHEEWKDNVGSFSLKAKGFQISGNITVNESDVELNSDVPFAVTLFSGTIKNMISKKAEELLS